MYSCTLMNITGDITISWDNSTSEEVKKWIQSKIEEGYTFFISEKKCFGLINSKKEINNIQDLNNSKGEIKLDSKQEKDFILNINSYSGDKGVEKLINTKKVKAKRTKKKYLNSNKVSTSVEEIVKSDSICMKPMMGG